jgi:hypothetical protein
MCDLTLCNSKKNASRVSDILVRETGHTALRYSQVCNEQVRVEQIAGWTYAQVAVGVLWKEYCSSFSTRGRAPAQA